MTKNQDFRVLSDEEFKALTTEEKVEYLKAGMEAQKRLTDQLVDAIREGLKNTPEPESGLPRRDD